MKRLLLLSLMLFALVGALNQPAMAQGMSYPVLLQIKSELDGNSPDINKVIFLFDSIGYGERAKECDGLDELDSLLKRVMSIYYSADSTKALAQENTNISSRANTDKTCASNCNANTGHNTQATCPTQTRSTCAGQSTCSTCSSSNTCRTCGSMHTCSTCTGSSTCSTCSSSNTCRTCGSMHTCSTCTGSNTCSTCASQSTCRTCANQSTCRTCAGQSTCSTCSSQNTCTTCSTVTCGYDNVTFVQHKLFDSNMNGYYEAGELVEIAVTVANNGNAASKYNVEAAIYPTSGGASVVTSRISYGRIPAYTTTSGNRRLSVRLPVNSSYSNISLRLDILHGSQTAHSRYIEIPIMPAYQNANRILVVIEDFGFNSGKASSAELVNSLNRLGQKCDVYNMATSPALTPTQLNAYKNGMVIANLPANRITQLAYTVQDYINGGGRLVIMAKDASLAYDSNPTLFRTMFGAYFENPVNKYQLDGRGIFAGFNLELHSWNSANTRSMVIDGGFNNYSASVQPLLGYLGDPYRLAGIAVDNYATGSRTALFNFELDQTAQDDILMGRILSYIMPYNLRMETYQSMRKGGQLTKEQRNMINAMREDLSLEAIDDLEYTEMIRNSGDAKLIESMIEFRKIDNMTN